MGALDRRGVAGHRTLGRAGGRPYPGPRVPRRRRERGRPGRALLPRHGLRGESLWRLDHDPRLTEAGRECGPARRRVRRDDQQLTATAGYFMATTFRLIVRPKN